MAKFLQFLNVFVTFALPNIPVSFSLVEIYKSIYDCYQCYNQMPETNNWWNERLKKCVEFISSFIQVVGVVSFLASRALYRSLGQTAILDSGIGITSQTTHGDLFPIKSSTYSKSHLPTGNLVEKLEHWRQYFTLK